MLGFGTFLFFLPIQNRYAKPVGVALMVVFSLFFFIMYAVSYFYRFDDSLPKLHTHICSGFSQ